eukprot:916222-Pyramimonas_sp.AAC.1
MQSTFSPYSSAVCSDESPAALPFRLDLVSGCISSYKRNADPCDRSQVIKVVEQFILEYSPTVPTAMPLENYIIHAVPPGLSELVGEIWKRPFDRVPLTEDGSGFC